MRSVLRTATVVALLLVAPVAAAQGKSHRRAHRCPKGQIRTRQGCRTPLTKSLVTFRSASHLVAAQLAPNVDGDSEIRWHTSVAYPYQRPCAGPALTGALAGPYYALVIPITTKTAYVGTTFSGSKIEAGGIQQESGGDRSFQVQVTAAGRVTSLKRLTGTVTITETRYFGPSNTQQTAYTTCGSSFAFTLNRYVGAYPGAASP